MGSCRRLPGHVHERVGLVHRERGPPRHPAGSPLHPVRPHLGRRRLLDHLRQHAAPGWSARRPGWAQARVSLRRHPLHDVVRDVWVRPGPGGADRRALPPGGGRCPLRLGDRRHHRDRVPGTGRPGSSHERLHLRGRGGRVDRAVGRRGHHPGAQLALDLLHQRAGRGVHVRLRAAAHQGECRAGIAERGGRERCRAGHGRPDDRRLRHRDGNRERMGIAAHRRLRRARPHPAGGIPVPRVQAPQPDHATADPAHSVAHDFEHRARLPGHRDVLHVLPRRPLFREGGRLFARSRPARPSCPCRCPWP